MNEIPWIAKIRVMVCPKCGNWWCLDGVIPKPTSKVCGGCGSKVHRGYIEVKIED